MRPIRLLAAMATAAVLAVSGRPATAEQVCQKWDLDVTCKATPGRVTIGDPFTATVSVKNTGDVPLANVTIQIRGDLGAHVPVGQPSPVSTVVERLEPGETKELSGTFLCDTGGVCRILGGARDLIGWAAANCACTVEVVGLPAIGSSMTDMDMKGEEKGVFVVGEEFQYVLEIKDDGGSSVTPDLKVVFSLPKELEFVGRRGDPGRDGHGAGPERGDHGLRARAERDAADRDPREGPRRADEQPRPDARRDPDHRRRRRGRRDRVDDDQD